MHRRKVTSQCRRNRNCSHIINTFGCRLLCGISIIGTVYTAIVYTTPFTLYHSLLLFTSYSLLLHFFLPFWIDINLTFEWHEIQYPSILVPRDSSFLSPFMPFRKTPWELGWSLFPDLLNPGAMAYSRGSGLRKLDDSCLPTKRELLLHSCQYCDRFVFMFMIFYCTELLIFYGNHLLLQRCSSLNFQY